MKTIDNIKIKKCVTLLVLMLFFLAESFPQFVNTYKDDEGRIAHTTLTVAGLAVEQGGQIVNFGFYSMNDTDYHYFAEIIGAITLSKDLRTLLITLLNPSATYKFSFVESTSNSSPITPSIRSGHMDHIICTVCNGTGKSAAKDYPPTFGLERSIMKVSCPYCNDIYSHSHKNCFVCNGTGKIQKWVP